MCEAFQTEQRYSYSTAAKVFNVAEEDVTKEMRYKAKSVNFGIIYGQGAFGLQKIWVFQEEKQKKLLIIIKSEFPNIQKYMDDQSTFAEKMVMLKH